MSVAPEVLEHKWIGQVISAISRHEQYHALCFELSDLGDVGGPPEFESPS